MSTGIYYEIYDLIVQYFYGVDAVLTPDMTLVVTLLATLASVFIVALPFILCLRFIKMVG